MTIKTPPNGCTPKRCAEYLTTIKRHRAQCVLQLEAWGRDFGNTFVRNVRKEYAAMNKNGEL